MCVTDLEAEVHNGVARLSAAAVPRAGEVTASRTPAPMLDRATRPTPRLLIFTVAGLRIPGDKLCSSAGGLQLKK